MLINKNNFEHLFFLIDVIEIKTKNPIIKRLQNECYEELGTTLKNESSNMQWLISFIQEARRNAVEKNCPKK